MDEKTITVEELLELAQSGAKVTTEKREHILAKIQQAEPGPTTIVQFDQFVEKLDEMMQANAGFAEAAAKSSETREAARLQASETRATRMAEGAEAKAAAEHANSQAQLEILATLQSMIKTGVVTKSQSSDLAPIQTVLSEIQENVRPTERPAYQFTVNRTDRGFIDSIIAKPYIEPKY